MTLWSGDVLTIVPQDIMVIQSAGLEAIMLVISILARKGGTGKSTAVRCLAVEALKVGRRVVIIDADPQATCYRWGQRRLVEGIPVPLVVVPAPGGLAAQIE